MATYHVPSLPVLITKNTSNNIHSSATREVSYQSPCAATQQDQLPVLIFHTLLRALVPCASAGTGSSAGARAHPISLTVPSPALLTLISLPPSSLSTTVYSSTITASSVGSSIASWIISRCSRLVALMKYPSDRFFARPDRFHRRYADPLSKKIFPQRSVITLKYSRSRVLPTK